MNEQPHALDDLTLAEVIDRLVRSPITTSRALLDYFMSAPPIPRGSEIQDDLALSPANRETILLPAPVRAAENAAMALDERDRTQATGRDWAILLAQMLGLTLAWAGTGIMAFASLRTEESALWTAAPFALLGTLIWLGAQFAIRTTHVPAFAPVTAPLEYVAPRLGMITRAFADSMQLRLLLIALAVMASIVTFVYSAGNTFRPVGVVAWVLSILFWLQALAPSGWSPLYPLRRWRARLLGTQVYSGRTADAMNGVPTPDESVGTPFMASGSANSASSRFYSPLWVSGALITILLLGAVFRLTDIAGTPPEMTSDHVEKLLDSQRVFDGGTQIYFQNNGGREPLQMYVMAAFVGLTGQPMDHDTLKLVTALEGILTIPIFFWLGRELVGRYNPRLGILVGLLLAGLIAASYWHVSLSRLALRIIYTPGIVALIFIYLARALRDNRRIDFLNAGLALGAGLYMYQVIRIMPVVVLVGVGTAVFLIARSWEERRRYLFNLAMLVIISFVVFMPLFRFSVDYPDDFWRRTSGRLFGDDLTQVVADDGTITERVPTFDERIAAFGENIPLLANNLRNALLMYNWKGDVAWISAAPNRPALDPLSGALLVVGIGAWIGWTIRKRDAALWLVLPAWFILIFPSALSIAYPIENPSATRMSGTLPFAYLIAAFGLATLLMAFMKIAPRRVGITGTVLAVIAALGISYGANWQTYFGDFRDTYLISSKPYSSAGALLRQFSTNEGSYGNAFMVGYPYWWDHRAIGIAGGRINWPNGIVTRDDIPRFLRDARARQDAYTLDADRPLLFMISPDDVDTELRLELWFPDGFAESVTTSHPLDTYRVYTVPPLGEDGLAAFIAEYAPDEDAQ